MTHETLHRRMIPLGKMLLFCGIVAGIMAGLGSAQENATGNYTCTGAEMGPYANLGFCLPPEVVVEPETLEEANYSSGSEITASMLLDGNRVALHLLYPCQAPQEELEPAALKPYLEGYDPIFAQATYNESVPGPALWGQLGNQMFVAYQPINQTIALVRMDMNMSEAMMTTFLGNLSIIVNEDVAPASNCPDTTAAPVDVQTNASQVAPAPAEVAENETADMTENQIGAVESPAEKIATGKEKMAADIEAIKAKIDASMSGMKKR